MRNKNLARTTPVDFNFPQLVKKPKSDIASFNQRFQYLYSVMSKEDQPNDLDLILGKLEELTVDTSKTTINNHKTEILDLQKNVLNILVESELRAARFESRYKATAIPDLIETVPPLTDEENKMVDRLFKKGQSGQVSEFKNAIVSYRDIYRLYPETWLNDEIVNFYFELISDRASKADNLPQIHCFNTFFCSTLRDQGYNKVRRWTKRVDIFSKDLVLVPINQSYHWVLGVMDMKHKKVTVYDSLHGNHDHTLELFLDYLEKEHLDKKKTPIDTSDWKKETPKDIPRQENMSDCGAFTCTFAERLSRQQPFGFSQSDMVTIRRRIALNILNKAI